MEGVFEFSKERIMCLINDVGIIIYPAGEKQS